MEKISKMQTEIENIIMDNTYPAKEITIHFMEFVVWYSGMEKEKVARAYERYLRESK